MKGVTAYQLETLTHIASGNPDGDGPIDFDRLLDKMSWLPTKQSAQFVIRALVSKKLILKLGTQMRRGRHRVCFQVTEEGKRVLDPRAPSGSVVTDSPGADLDLDVAFEGLEIS